MRLAVGHPDPGWRERTIRSETCRRQIAHDSAQIGKSYALADEERDIGMPDALGIDLRRFFEPEVVKLERILGRDLSAWKRGIRS